MEGSNESTPLNLGVYMEVGIQQQYHTLISDSRRSSLDTTGTQEEVTERLKFYPRSPPARTGFKKIGSLGPNTPNLRPAQGNGQILTNLSMQTLAQL